MYVLKHGWTKEKVMAQIKKYNNGTMATNDGFECVYKTEKNNRCAIGAFIPDDFDPAAFEFTGSSTDLLRAYPALLKHMPFKNLSALRDLQKTHDDSYKRGTTTYDAIQGFLNACVEEAS